VNFSILIPAIGLCPVQELKDPDFTASARATCSPGYASGGASAAATSTARSATGTTDAWSRGIASTAPAAGAASSTYGILASSAG
jgi:hypothetical protein